MGNAILPGAIGTDRVADHLTPLGAMKEKIENQDAFLGARQSVKLEAPTAHSI